MCPQTRVSLWGASSGWKAEVTPAGSVPGLFSLCAPTGNTCHPCEGGSGDLHPARLTSPPWWAAYLLRCSWWCPAAKMMVPAVPATQELHLGINCVFPLTQDPPASPPPMLGLGTAGECTVQCCLRIYISGQ